MIFPPRRSRPALAASFALLLAACATVNEAPVVDLTEAPPPRPRAAAPAGAGDAAPAAAPGTHVVARGDTLYGIAFRHGLDFRQLAEWNRVPPPFTIRPGQVLRLSAPMAPVDPGNAIAQRSASSPAPDADPAPAVAAAAEDDTVALGSPDWNEDVPSEGEARTFGIDDVGTTPTAAGAPPATAPLGDAPESGLGRAGPTAVPAPARESGVPSSGPTATAPADATTLRPAPDGAMPPPMP